LNLKFLNELAASNNRNFKFTALGAGPVGQLSPDTSPPPSGLLRANTQMAVGGGFTAYVPDWEQLAEALKRVIEAGFSRSEAQRDICRAIIDGKIKVRFSFELIKKHHSRSSDSSEAIRPPPPRH
jgi:hypothetical protein